MEVTKLSINAYGAVGTTEKAAAVDPNTSTGSAAELATQANTTQELASIEQAGPKLTTPMSLTLPAAFSTAIEALSAVFGPMTIADLDPNQVGADLDSQANSNIVIGAGAETAVVAAELAIPTILPIADLNHGVYDELTEFDYSPEIAHFGVNSAEDLGQKVKFSQNPLPIIKINWSTISDLDSQSADLAALTAGGEADLDVPAADVADPELLNEMYKQLSTDEATPEELKAMYSQQHGHAAAAVPNFASASSSDLDVPAADLLPPSSTFNQVAQLSADLNLGPTVADVENWAADFASGDEFAAMVQQTAADLDTDVKINFMPSTAADVATPEEFEAMIQQTAADLDLGQSVDLNLDGGDSIESTSAASLIVNQGSIDVDNLDLNNIVTGVAQDNDQLAADLLTKATDQRDKADVEVGLTSADIDPSLSTDELGIHESVIHPAADMFTDSDLNGPEKPTSRSLTPKEVGLVHEQIADRLEVLAATKPRHGVTIHLEPRELGSLTLVVRNTGREVEAEILASHDGVRAALEATRNDLAKVLDQRGFNLTQIQVTGSEVERSRLETNGDRSFQNAQAQAQQTGNTIRLGRYESISDALSVDQIREFTRKSTGVDLWI